MNFLKKHKHTIIYICTVIFSILYIIIGNKLCMPKNLSLEPAPRIEIMKVNRIVDVLLDEFSLDESSIYVSKTIIFEGIIKTGDAKGETCTVNQTVDPLIISNPKDVEEGDTIIAMYDTTGVDDIAWYFMEYKRSDYLIALGVVFLVLLLIFGRKKGVNTIVSLGFTCLAVFAVFVPSVLAGMNIYVTASVTCLFIIFMTLLIINGADRKSFCASVGCLGGLTVTGILTLIMDRILHLTGATTQEAQFLLLLNEDKPIDLRAIIFGAIIIGALGATMDVSMSISSSLKELSDNMENKTYARLVKSGFNIGRDIMGTMANTLILAYIGSSLSVVLLLIANSNSLIMLFNREMIVVEIMQSLVGSLGILFTIPITSVLAAFVYNLKPKAPQHVALNAATPDTIHDLQAMSTDANANSEAVRANIANSLIFDQDSQDDQGNLYSDNDENELK